MKIAGRIVGSGIAKGVIHIEDGIITKISKSGKADLDVGDALIMPGAVDLHVHFRDPGQTYKEDWASGTASAACGGVTMVVDMPNTVPATTSTRTVTDKVAVAKESAHVDFGLWGGATWYTGDVPTMLNDCVGMKAYLGATTGDLLLEDSNAFKEVLNLCGQADRAIILHAEAQRILKQHQIQEAVLRDHHVARPPMAEVESIYDVMKLMPGLKHKPRVHIAHMASVEAVQAAHAAKFSTGVCPHHLLLDVTMFDEKPAYGKMNPPLRDPKDREALWKAYTSGAIGILESDHAPHTRNEKSEVFSQAPAGVPGVETMVPLLMAKVLAGELDAKLLAATSAAHPAALLGLKDRGVIEVGRRADLAIYGAEVSKVVAKNMHGKIDWNPYEGMDAVFPSHVFLAGEAIVTDGKLVGKPGIGQHVRLAS